MGNFFESSIFDFFAKLVQQKAFLAAFMGWLSAQVTKSIISAVVNFNSLIKRKRNLSDDESEDIRMVRDMMNSLFWKTGGMPSSHASMATALTTAVGFEAGFTSNIFVVAFFFTTIVLRDATGVRLLAGKLARITNLLIENNNKQVSVNERIKKLKVVEGHTLSEVFVGVVLGVFMSIITYQF